MEEIKDTVSSHTREAWDKLYNRLQADDLIPAQSAAAKSRQAHAIIRIAAVAIILLGAAAVLYMFTSRKPAVIMVRLNTHNETNTLVKTLEDGSVVYLAQNSQFSFPEEFKSASRTVELKGEAFFDIMPDPGKPFVIETRQALIQVLGTAFNVKTISGDSFELYVDHGKVSVTLKRDPSHTETLVAGEKLSGYNLTLVRSKHVANDASLWYKQRMHFKDEKLRDIISVLNRNFNTNFVLAANDIGNHRLTVTFQNETAGTMTELICAALNLKCQTINGSVVLSEKRPGAKQN